MLCDRSGVALGRGSAIVSGPFASGVPRILDPSRRRTRASGAIQFPPSSFD